MSSEFYQRYSSKYTYPPNYSLNYALAMGKSEMDKNPSRIYFPRQNTVQSLATLNVKPVGKPYVSSNRHIVPDLSGMNNSSQKVPDDKILSLRRQFMSPPMPIRI